MTIKWRAHMSRLTFVALLTGLIVIFDTTPSQSAQCDLSGKQVTVQYTTRGNPHYSGRSLEERQRFSIVGDKVLHSHDEISDEGAVYQIGRTLDRMQDPVQAKILRGKLFDKFPPGTYVEGEAGASYSGNQ